MNGNVTDSKIAKRKQREQRTIVKIEKELARPQSRSYIYYLFFIICIVYIADEVATQIGTQMQSVVAQALFAPIFGDDVAVARMGAIGMVVMPFIFLAFLYKPLIDRYGRRLFLIINTLGMGVGLLVISIATGIPTFLLGSVMVTFFIPHDVQRIYILETMPDHRRATGFSVVKAVATLGMLLIPLLRNLMMGDDITRWRYVYLAAGIFVVVTALTAALLIRETRPFLRKRLEYLKSSDEERVEAKKDKGAERRQGSLIAGFKYGFRHRQIRWLLLGGGFLMWGMVITMYYETIMTLGYAARAADLAGVSAREYALPFVTRALFLFPIGSALFQSIQGFMSDKWGRKPTTIIMGVTSISMYILFIIGSGSAWTPYLIGFLCGGAVGSYFAMTDINGIMFAESTPTNLRASVLAIQPIICGMFVAVSGAIATVLLNIMGDAYAGIISVSIAVPAVLVGFILVVRNVKETKDFKLEDVTGYDL